MKIYANKGGDSNVESYEIGRDFIAVNFKGTTRSYLYSYASAGSLHVEKMKELAENGLGLYTYIMLKVKENYERL